MSTVFPTINRGVPVTTTHYRPSSYVPQQTTTQRPGPNVTDDYERWYTEATPNNRMLLSLRSGIDTEIGWALDRLCRLCDNEQFLLRAIPGLTDALFEWPEWYANEPDENDSGPHSLFAPPLDTERRQRHALESLFILRNAALNEPNALELASHPRTQPLIIKALRNRQANSDRNTEFLIHILELLQAVATKVIVPHPSMQANPISQLQRIAAQSSDRSLIIASLMALTQVLSNTPNAAYLESNSPAFLASIMYLPLFTDKSLVDACLNYLYVHLSQPNMAKAFLYHPGMPGTLKLLVSLLLSEQVEETVSLDVGGVVHAVPALTVATRDHELGKDELDALLEKTEPQRCYEWMKIMFVAKPDGELTQVDFWNLYKDAFVPHQDRFPPLVASDVIKNVNVVFPQAQAMVLPGPPQKFVVRGVDRRKDPIANERFKCLWDRAQCSTLAYKSPGELYEHILQHLAMHEGPEFPCLWSSCEHPASAKSSLRAHILTHIPSAQPLHRDPSQDDTVTLPSESSLYPTDTPTRRPPPPLRKTTVSYRKPLGDPPSSSLTALLCLRVLFRASFVSTDTAPRADADHFGFPGVVEETEEQENAEFGSGNVALESEREGERRGRMAFVGVRRLMEAVRMRDETLMGWITEMVDAGLSGTN